MSEKYVHYGSSTKDNVVSFYEKKEEMDKKMLAASPEWQQYLFCHNKKMRKICGKISRSLLKIKVYIMLIILAGIVVAVQDGNSNALGIICSMAFCTFKIETNIEGYVLAWVPLEDKFVK